MHFKTVHSTVQWRRVEIKTVHCCHLTTSSASRRNIAGLYNVHCSEILRISLILLFRRIQFGRVHDSGATSVAPEQHLWYQADISKEQASRSRLLQAAGPLFSSCCSCSSDAQCDAHLGDAHCAMHCTSQTIRRKRRCCLRSVAGISLSKKRVQGK